jgi:hypothetical protein
MKRLYDEERMAKLIGDALELAADLARHVAWYVSHQVHPEPRERP